MLNNSKQRKESNAILLSGEVIMNVSCIIRKNKNLFLIPHSSN